MPDSAFDAEEEPLVLPERGWNASRIWLLLLSALYILIGCIGVLLGASLVWEYRNWQDYYSGIDALVFYLLGPVAIVFSAAFVPGITGTVAAIKRSTSIFAPFIGLACSLVSVIAGIYFAANAFNAGSLSLNAGSLSLSLFLVVCMAIPILWTLCAFANRKYNMALANGAHAKAATDPYA